MFNAKLSNKVWRQIGKDYNIPVEAVVTPFNISVNRTFLICLPDGSKQILRLSRSSIRIEDIQAELNVLVYLQRESSLNINVPIITQNGQLYTTIFETSEHKPTIAAMFSFVNGDVVEKIISEDMMFLVGKALGRLDFLLGRADLTINPTPSKVRPRLNISHRIYWALSKLKEHIAEYDFLKENVSRKRLNPKILSIARRLKRHLCKVERHLPHQLIHADANLSNLVFDGNKIGIFDFDDMCYGPHTWELAAPLHSIFFPEEVDIFTYTDSLPVLTVALLDGYMTHIPFSKIELLSFPLLQALRLFGGMGWEVSRQHPPEDKETLEHNGTKMLNQIADLIEVYENDLIFNIFWKPKLRKAAGSRLFK